jgi:hypothetical protein
MAKKEAKKQIHHEYSDLEKTLIANFVSLQKVLVHLSGKFDDLSGNLSKLLELFEISAKTLAEKELTEPSVVTDQETSNELRKVSEKLNNLLEQNKVIARGLTLMYERIPNQPQQVAQPIMPRPIQRPNPGQDINEKPISYSDYQKSISE